MALDRRSALLDMIERFVPSDAIEAGHVASMKRLLASEGDPFSRSHYAPGHVTASAFVIHPASKRILLHHHRRLDRWLQLGGHVDPGEDVVTAALREAREESGLTDVRLLIDGPFDIDDHFIPAARGEPAHHHFDARFLVITARPDDATIALEESLDLAWLDFDEAERRMNAPESTRAIGKIRQIVES